MEPSRRDGKRKGRDAAATAVFEAGRLRHPTNQAAFAYWDRIRAGRAMPARADLDPSDIRTILPCVFLLDVARDPLDFRYRLIGTKMASHLNRDLTGTWMSEIPHQRPPSRIWSACARVVETRTPLSSDTPYVGKHHEYKKTEDLILPLSADGETVNMLFVTADFLP
ncbi:MAG: PAS domain-containing protein [Kiloniellales bacterium]|nr:PAS domain-containing protein [Kiloniellales bacterium]